MDQDVEVVGAADALGDTTALGAVTGDCDYDEFRLTGSRKKFRYLEPGAIHILENNEIVEIVVFRGPRVGREHRSLIRLRAGANCHLTGPLEWRPKRNAPRWDPVPAEIALLTSWVHLCVAVLLVVGAAWPFLNRTAASLVSASAFPLEGSFVHAALIAVGLAYGRWARIRTLQARIRSKVLSGTPTSFRVASVYPSATVSVPAEDEIPVKGRDLVSAA